jgi:DNA-directed RNA polymerase specialized sigma24 family protein
MNGNLAVLHNYFSVEANLSYLCRFISRRVSDPQLVDDLAQDTIMAVYRHFENDKTAIKSEQLTGFVCHTSKFIMKRNWKHQRRITMELHDADIPIEDAYVGLIEFEAIQAMAALCAGWAKSSDKHRRWSLLHSLHDLSCEEIADMENTSVSAVRKAIYRVKKGTQPYKS